MTQSKPLRSFSPFLTPSEEKNIILSRCCESKGDCLCAISHSIENLSKSFKVLRYCREEVATCTKEELDDYLRSKMIELVLFKSASNHKSTKQYIDYRIGNGSKSEIGSHSVCSSAFARAYGVKPARIKFLAKQIKDGFNNSTKDYSDRSLCHPQIVSSLDKVETANGKKLTETQLTAMLIPNTPVSARCAVWMDVYFGLCGDKAPNKCEIHLEPIDKKLIWIDYVQSCKEVYKDDDHLGYVSFCKLWLIAFPHVKIREYKQVFYNLLEFLNY